jgi:TonB family protein
MARAPRSARHSLAASIFTSFLIVLGAVLPANADSHSPIRALSDGLRKKIADAKSKSLAISDFAAPDGAPSGEGLYFADILYLYLEEQTKRIGITDRDAVSHFLTVHNLALGDLTSKEILNRIGDSLHVDTILCGSVERAAGSLTLTASLMRTADASVIASDKIVIDSDAFYESLRSYPATQTPAVITQLTEKGVRAPEFLDVPAPQFRGPADSSTGDRNNALILLNIVVSGEGRVTNLRVVRGAGPEFADIAWRAIRAWHFKPGVDRNGKTVAVVMPMEVVFRVTR